MKSIIFASFILCGSICFAQGDYRKGYIITNVGDSINGWVEYRVKTTKSCHFKSSKHGKQTKYSPSQLECYGFIGGKRFVSRKVGQDYSLVFAELLVSGPMSLLRFNEMYLIEQNTIIELPKPKRRIFETEGGPKMHESKTYIGLLNYELLGCGLSANSTQYDELPLTNLVQNFNRCKGRVGVVYKEKLKWTKIDFQLFSGLDIAELKFPEFSTGISPVYGGGVNISSPRVFDRLFFNVDVHYTRKIFLGYTESSNKKMDHTINIDMIKVPLTIRYNFFNDNNTPFLKMGFVKYFETSSYWNTLTETDLNGVVTTSYSTTEILDKAPLSVCASVGYNRIIYSRFKGFLELRYERGVNSSPVRSVVNLNAGLRF